MYSYCLVAERWDDGTRDTTFGSRCRCRTRCVWESVEKVLRRRQNDKTTKCFFNEDRLIPPN